MDLILEACSIVIAKTNLQINRIMCRYDNSTIRDEEVKEQINEALDNMFKNVNRIVEEGREQYKNQGPKLKAVPKKVEET